MSKDSWTHAICAVCFERRYPGRIPTRLTNPDEETCCYCGKPTKDGIYARGDPRILHASEYT